MRKAGILMHLTSLPGPYGVGTMGKSAYAFLDFLHKSGQQAWQMLPLGPTGYGDSPYQSCSAYAGNPYLIDLDTLVRQHLLTKEEVLSVDWGDDETQVDFGKLYNGRTPILKLAYSRFRNDRALNAFIKRNAQWLPDFTLYMALKERHGFAPWFQWEEELKLRKPEALEEAARELEEEIRFYSFVQYEFYKQWDALRKKAKALGIELIGDVPIYVPYDSVEVWKNPELFQLDEDLAPTAVAGCPPDAFTADGQLWGNPLYRWDVMEEQGYRWWLDRLGASGKLFDVVRLDHFRGFEAYWSVPYGDETARNGHWVKGPGMSFVNALKKGLPQLDFVAEDLGYLTEEVLQLRDDSGYPGMKVLEFAFDSREESDYMPHLYPVDSVCYTGTHDNVTLKQWFDEAAPEDVACAKTYLGLNREEGYIRGMIRGCMGSVSRLCVVQMQDYLELGKEARMNFPGTLSSANWTWRAEKGFDSDALAARIYAATKLYGRVGK